MDFGHELESRAGVGSALLFGAWTTVFVCLLLAASFGENVDIALYGAAACLIVTIPALQRGYDWVSPWSLVMLAFYIGCGARGLAIIDLGLDDPLVQKLYLLGRDVDEYRAPALLFLLGVALLTFGWMVSGISTSRRVRRTVHEGGPLKVHGYTFGRFFWPVVLVCAVVGLAGFFGYASATGGLDLTNLSAKRAGYYVDHQANYQGAAGPWRALNDLSTVAFLLAVAKVTAIGRLKSLPQILLILTLFLNAAILPIYSSVRSDVMYLVLTALVVHVCIQGRAHRRLLWLSGVTALLLLAILTLLRQESEGKMVEFSFSEIIRGVSDAMLLNQNFAEIPKAVNVMLAVPDTLPYSYGSSIGNYGLASIPRSVWADKPIIDAGVEVGVIIYGTDGSSIPPGAIAEFYWMLGAVTLILGSFLLGFALGRVHAWTRPRTGNVRGALMYGTAIFGLGGNAVSGSVGYAVFSAVMAGVTMAVVLKFVGGPPTDAYQIGATILDQESSLMTAQRPARY